MDDLEGQQVVPVVRAERALPVTPGLVPWWGESHWLPFQRLTHLLDSILQHS